MSDTQNSLLELVNNLQSALSKNDLTWVLKTTKKLKSDKNYQLTAVNIEAIALIRRGEYAKAIDLIKSYGLESSFENLILYSRYKQNLFSSVYSRLEKISDLSLFQKELLFQLNYYDGNFSHASTLADDAFNRVSAEIAGSLKDKTSSNIDIFQDVEDLPQCFNYCCYLISKNLFYKALTELLKLKSISTLNSTKYSNLMDKISIQINYCRFMLNRKKIKTKEIVKYSENTVKPFHRLIMISNYISSKKFNKYSSMKKYIDLIYDSLRKTHVPEYILKVVIFNLYILSFNPRKRSSPEADKYMNILKLKLQETPEYTLMNLYQMYHKKIKIVEPQKYADKFDSISLKLTVIEILNSQRSTQIGMNLEILTILEDLNKRYSLPILVAYTCRYIEKNFTTTQAISFMLKHLENYTGPAYLSLISILIKLYIRSADLSQALQYISILIDRDVDHRYSNYEKLIIHLKSNNSGSYIGLRPVNIDISPQYIMDLENSITQIEKSSKNEIKKKDDTKMMEGKKRKGKKKLPTYYDPSFPPDPERWLPKYERTGYRSKKKKSKKGAHQGAVYGEIPEPQQKVATNSPAKPPSRTFKGKGKHHKR